jgi:hypothetical protein
MERVIIQSVAGEGRLELTEPTRRDPRGPVESFRAALTIDALHAESVVEVEPIGPEDLAELLRDLAAEPEATLTRERGWGSPEGRLAMSFSKDRTGKVKVEVELREDPRPDAWSVRGTLHLDQRSLQWAAHATRRFLM